MAKTKILQFPVNNDLATTGHKLQGMTKKFIIVSQLNYSTVNWIYVVLSRVTKLSGLFLLHPIKPNFNPKPTKLLVNEWKQQQKLEKELLLHLQKYGNFPPNINIIDLFDHFGNASVDEAVTHFPSCIEKWNILEKFDFWLCQNKMKRISHLTPQYGNCLYDSVAKLIPEWSLRGTELRYETIKWAQHQVLQMSQWGLNMCEQFEATKDNPDAYMKDSFMDYLEYLKNPTVYGTEYDIVVLCEFLQVSIHVFSSSQVAVQNGTLQCTPPYVYGNEDQLLLKLWHVNEHYEPILDM